MMSRKRRGKEVTNVSKKSDVRTDRWTQAPLLSRPGIACQQRIRHVPRGTQLLAPRWMERQIRTFHCWKIHPSTPPLTSHSVSQSYSRLMTQYRGEGWDSPISSWISHTNRERQSRDSRPAVFLLGAAHCHSMSRLIPVSLRLCAEQ